MTDIVEARPTELDPWFLIGSLGMRLRLDGVITVEDWDRAVNDAIQYRARHTAAAEAVAA